MWWWIAVAAARPVILGGELVDPSSWPAVVALVDADDTLVCTGTLVAPDVVLAAAHCGTPAVVALGASPWMDGARVGIAEVEAHPRDLGGLDLAWFRLVEPVDRAVASVVRPDDVAGVTAGQPVWFVGYGAADEASQVRDGRLRAATAIVVDPICDDPAVGCRGGVPPEAELIAGGDGIDTCIGDSGGPLFLGEGADLRLWGVTSRGVLGSRRSCGDGGIFVRLDGVGDWLTPVLPTPDDEDAVDPTGCGCGHAPGPVGWLALTPLWCARRRCVA